MNVIIRKPFKLALAVPVNAANAKLWWLGMNNTFEELVDAHLAGQLERLVLTPTVRNVLSSLGIPIPASQRGTIKLPLVLRDKIHVALYFVSASVRARPML